MFAGISHDMESAQRDLSTQPQYPGRLSLASQMLHRLEAFTTRSGTATFVGSAVFVVVIAIVASGFNSEFQVGFATICSGVTVVMVFVLQHTQRRSQLATQLKLDELVRAMPQADNRMCTSKHHLTRNSSNWW